MPIHRRTMLQALTLAPFASAAHAAQPALRKVRVAEVVHLLFYAPLYIAINKGFFRDHGLDVELVPAVGSDKAMTALLSGSTEIALAGPETTVYIQDGESPMKTKIISGLTATDGSFLMGPASDKPFDWRQLKGKRVLSWREGSSPALFLEEILRHHGLDPQKDVQLISNIAIPARMGAFISGAAEYGTFFEPNVSKLVVMKKAQPLASVGNSLGMIDYTVLIATDATIRKDPRMLQDFVDAMAKSLHWVAKADPKQAAAALAPSFPGLPMETLETSFERQRKANLWKTSPLVQPQAIDALQQLLIDGGILKPAQKVKYSSVVDPVFARAAKA